MASFCKFFYITTHLSFAPANYISAITCYGVEAIFQETHELTADHGKMPKMLLNIYPFSSSMNITSMNHHTKHHPNFHIAHLTRK